MSVECSGIFHVPFSLNYSCFSMNRYNRRNVVSVTIFERLYSPLINNRTAGTTSVAFIRVSFVTVWCGNAHKSRYFLNEKKKAACWSFHVIRSSSIITIVSRLKYGCCASSCSSPSLRPTVWGVLWIELISGEGSFRERVT